MRYVFFLYILPFVVQLAACLFSKKVWVKLAPVFMNVFVCFVCLVWAIIVAQPELQQYATYNLCGNFVYISDPLMLIMFCIVALCFQGIGWLTYVICWAIRYLLKRGNSQS